MTNKKEKKLPKITNRASTTSHELREDFLSFFEEQSHQVKRSSSLIPFNDPTLLFTSAGMVQFKSYFEGTIEPPSKRVVTAQKCFRTTDIELVGDTSHLTFFEMLGNFSFGDYFKKEACKWALELMCDKLKFDFDRLVYTVHEKDLESRQIWRDLGIKDSKIFDCDDTDNWWGPAGGSGPCGPCSEIHVYLGEERMQENMHPNSTEDFLELYNLVFTQFYRDESGKDIPLKNKNIDTGLGVERTLGVMNRALSVYETDLFSEMMAYIFEKKKKSFAGEVIKTRVVAEHIRSATFLIGDGVVPSNTGRGYILRRILRRALGSANELEFGEKDTLHLVEILVEMMGDVYTEIRENKYFIREVIKNEKTAFERTLKQGLSTFKSYASNLKTNSISGPDAAKLFDTYGLPFASIKKLSKEHGLTLAVDEEGFKKSMQALALKASSSEKSFQKPKEDAHLYKDLVLKSDHFLGYETTHSKAKIVGIIADEKRVNYAKENQKVYVVLDQTPFYAERGGQVGDKGVIEIDKQNLGYVYDTKPSKEGVILHYVEVKLGKLCVGDFVQAKVKNDLRERTMRNHTATHLVHAALRDTLGKHVRQSGSVVAPDYLRFDFTHIAPLSSDEIEKVEGIVNEKIRANLPVEVHMTTFDKAVNEGALAFFGDRYDDEVRTIKIDYPWSYELCGGTHMHSTGGIGSFIITGQSSIGSGLRRIVALSGVKAEEQFKQERKLVTKTADLLGVQVAQIETQLLLLQKELSTTRSKLKKTENMLIEGGELGSSSIDQQELSLDIDGISFGVTTHFGKFREFGLLGKKADVLKPKNTPGVVLVYGVIEEELKLVVSANPKATDMGFDSSTLCRSIMKSVGGQGGGGKKHASGGGGNFDKLKSTLSDKEGFNLLVIKAFSSKKNL